MTTWTDIANSEVDQDSPITQTLMTALRDNPVAIAEQSTGTIYNENMWHPYNGVKVGDGNDGVYWDHSVDGNSSMIDSPALEDRYEYAVLMIDYTGTSSVVQTDLLSATQTNPSTSSVDTAGTFINGMIIYPRIRELVSGYRCYGFFTATPSGRYLSVPSGEKPTNIRIRLGNTGAGSSSRGGKLALYRRRYV